MPYFITDESADCSGWATIKDDGEVIGCHTTKQDAIDQMVAVSIAEDIEPGGERAEPDSLNVGDYVSWNSSGGRARGRIVRILRDGVLQIPDTDFSIEASAEDPAALIRIYREEDNEYVATDTLVGHKFSTLTKINDLRNKRALPEELNVGDYAMWFNGDNLLQGKIVEIQFDGELRVPNSDVILLGTPFNPAALIQVYEEIGNVWKDTNVFVGVSFDQLRKAEDLDLEEDVKEDMEEEFSEEEEDMRAINQEPPAYMRAAARRGLELNADGKGGDGLTEKTIREARLMADGQVSDDKWIRIAAWIARHMPDLDAPQNNDPNDSGYPGAGLVAHLLWGSGPSKRAAQRTMEYAQGVVERIRREEEQARWASVNVQLREKKEEKMPSTVERRINDVTFEIRQGEVDANKMTFTGYAAVFNSPSEPLPFTEFIMPGAFKRSLKSRNEVKLFMNHNMDIVLGSTRAKTLRLTEDSKGLLAEAVLPDTTAGRDLSVLMQRGDVNSMSFGFSVPAKGDRWTNEGMTRELHQIRLHEVSIVTGFPAYEATTASVRSIDALATRTGMSADVLADALTRLEAGENLSLDHASTINEAVAKLKESVPNEAELVAIKQKQLDLMLKAI